jgi:hypothetical protein
MVIHMHEIEAEGCKPYKFALFAGSSLEVGGIVVKHDGALIFLCFAGCKDSLAMSAARLNTHSAPPPA